MSARARFASVVIAGLIVWGAVLSLLRRNDPWLAFTMLLGAAFILLLCWRAHRHDRDLAQPAEPEVHPLDEYELRLPSVRYRR